jgi:sugar phosphate isomerase/epimerase
MSNDRRNFVKDAALLAAGLALAPQTFAMKKKKFFEISLAEWSLHKTLFAKKMDNLDFPVVAKRDYGISVVEYVNQFFKDKAKDTNYLNELLKRCNDNGVKNHLIMIDGEGGMGDTDNAKRTKAVENHYKWVDAAKYLGCKTIRVNAYGEGTAEDVQKAAVDGLSRLGEYAKKVRINVIVENHGGYSSNGQWLSGVMKSVGMKNVGTLPDLGNFCIKHTPDYKCLEEYDRYKGTQELMPFAKGVSAKTREFDEAGNCIETDYKRMFRIIKDAGFKGYIGIEYEGNKLSEDEGIRKTKALIERAAASLS